MTEQEQQTAKDAALGKILRLKQDLAFTMSRAKSLAEQMEGVAQLLRKNPRNVAFGLGGWMNDEEVRKTVDDIARAEEELTEARHDANGLGVAVPPEL